jgi:hypothetical protein
MLDQITDAMMAPSLHDDAGHLIARLVTGTPTAYVIETVQNVGGQAALRNGRRAQRSATV